MVYFLGRGVKSLNACLKANKVPLADPRIIEVAVAKQKMPAPLQRPREHSKLITGLAWVRGLREISG